MINIKIPNFLNFSKKIGLLISDDEVSIVSWKRGVIEKLALFKNDDKGVIRFIDHLRANGDNYKGKSFYVLTNIIGEDYRFERIAHLIGKYKTDFHARRMAQLFRQSSLCLSEVQGREERGRREDWVLFFGLLTENKVLPWVNAILRGDRFLAGIFAVSFVTQPLLRNMGVSGGSSGNQLIMTLHENNLLRQTFYINGNIRFSRVSKINEDNAEALSLSVKKELERTLQYLTSLKISIKDGVTVQFVSPSEMVSQLREILKSGDRIRFSFHDAVALAQSEHLYSSFDQIGKDSSLALHLMFSYFRTSQLASVARIQLHLLNQFSKSLIFAFLVYGAYNLGFAIFNYQSAYFKISLENDASRARVEELEKNYQRELAGQGTPGSTAENMQAVIDTFKAIDKIDTSPTRLMFYFSQKLEKNPGVKLKNLKWFVSNDEFGSGDPSIAPVSGLNLYQILEVSGSFIPLKANETYVDIYKRAEAFIASFESDKRSDIIVDAVKLPIANLSSLSLQGSLEEGYAVDAAQERDFVIRIIWLEYSEEHLKRFTHEI